MPATRKHIHVSKPRRRQRSVSLTTRASRCGVKNFVNVLKSLHPQTELFFPVTKEYMQEYITIKRKQGSIKANSLDQYFQHIESYNMALGHGWDAEIFEPMMREVLEDLEKAEEKARAERKLAGLEDDVRDIPMGGVDHENQMNDIRKRVTIENGVDHARSHHDSVPFFQAVPHAIAAAPHAIVSPPITLVCFDTSQTPHIKLDATMQIPLVNINFNDSSLAIRQIYEMIPKLRFPKRWGDVDTSTIYYRSEEWEELQHYALTDENACKVFWQAYQVGGGQIQFVVYSKRSSVPKALDIDSSSQTSVPLAPLTPRKSPPRLSNLVNNNIDMISGSPTPSPTFQQVKSVTIRSPSKVYKTNIAVTDTTTFESLLKFAIRKSPPPGKQFVLQSADGELEYMPEDPVRKVIYGMPHADVVVRMEDLRDIDFAQF